MATTISADKGTVDRKAVITLALLYFVRDDYPDEEEPYVKIATIARNSGFRQIGLQN